MTIEHESPEDRGVLFCGSSFKIFNGKNSKLAKKQESKEKDRCRSKEKAPKDSWFCIAVLGKDSKLAEEKKTSQPTSSAFLSFLPTPFLSSPICFGVHSPPCITSSFFAFGCTLFAFRCMVFERNDTSSSVCVTMIIQRPIEIHVEGNHEQHRLKEMRRENEEERRRGMVNKTETTKTPSSLLRFRISSNNSSCSRSQLSAYSPICRRFATESRLDCDQTQRTRGKCAQRESHHRPDLQSEQGERKTKGKGTISERRQASIHDSMIQRRNPRKRKKARKQPRANKTHERETQTSANSKPQV